MAKRITAVDSPTDMVVKLSEDVPGAVAVLKEILEHGGKIDPYNSRPTVALLTLDSHGIYGEDIWQLHKHVCGGDIEKMMAVLRANQLGLIKPSDIHAAVQGSRMAIQTLDVDALLAKVRERRSLFGVRGQPSRTPEISGEGRPGLGTKEEAALVALLTEGGVDKEVSWRDGSFIRYDAEGKIHCDGAPAVRDSDGREIWFEHGRKMDGHGMDKEKSVDWVTGRPSLS